MIYSNDKVKRILKSELIKRGISTSDLVDLLNSKGINETLSSINSKISRGTFSAVFFLDCLCAIGCTKLEIEEYSYDLKVVAEPNADYKKLDDEK